MNCFDILRLSYRHGFHPVAICGILIASLGSQNFALAQSADSAAQSQVPAWRPNCLRPLGGQPLNSENQLQIVGSSPAVNSATGSLRFVHATEVSEDVAARTDPSMTLAAQPLPLEAEPLPPGTPAPPEPGPTSAPPAVPLPGSQGTYERIDTSWKPIGAVSASTTPPRGELPVDFAGPVFAQAGAVVAPINATHDWPTMTYAWEASAVPHRPLYFEEVNLERYGYTHGILQPWISGGRFFINVVFLPYHIFNEPPKTIEYPLGYARPGDKAPPVREIKPVKLTAVAAEAAFVVGMVILLP